MLADVECHWTGSDRKRGLGERHEGSHEHCAPCEARHCRICGVNHVIAQTCATCVNDVRSDLVLIPQLVDELPEQMLDGSTPGGRLLAAQPIPGGDAMVLLAGGSDARNQTYEILNGIVRHGETKPAPWADDEHAGDPEPPLQVLAFWEDDWRATFGHSAAGLADIERAAAYLKTNLDLAAQTHDAFDEFAEHIRNVRGGLEDATGHGTGNQEGTSCLHCGATLVRKAKARRERGRCNGHEHTTAGSRSGAVCPWPHQGCCDSGGVDFEGEWQCLKCKRSYDHQAYDKAVHASFLLNAPALNARDMHQVHGVKRGSLTGWASTGKVRKHGKDENGRTLYDVSDVQVMLSVAS